MMKALNLCIGKGSQMRAPRLPLRQSIHSNGAKTFMPSPDNPNYGLIQQLIHEMETEARQEKVGIYKARAFERAIKAIELLPWTITSASEASKVYGVGAGIARRIEEYLTPGYELSPKAGKARQLTPDEVKRERVLSELKRVPGIGVVKARKLFDAGCLSLEDLRIPEYLNTLSTSTKTALDYVDHLEQRVTRSQVDIVMTTIKPIISSEIRMHVVGSYRRGSPTCTDIDVILFHPACVYVPRPGEKRVYTDESSSSRPRRGRPAKPTTNLRKKQDTLLREFVVSPLEHAGVIAATLAEGPRKWQGIVRIPVENESNHERAVAIRDKKGLFRRMDLTLFPCLSEGAALLASTGDAEFNTHARGVASKMGLHLNEFGLWRFCKKLSTTGDIAEQRNDSDVEAEGRWDLVVSESEQKILEELAMEYVEPEQRNLSFTGSRRNSVRAAGARRFGVVPGVIVEK